MHLYESETFWHIKIRPAQPDIFQAKAERFSFLNIWRTYFINSLNTCAYVLVPGSFNALVSLTGKDLEAEKIEEFVAQKLQRKLAGIFPRNQIDLMAASVTAERIPTEQDCINKTFELHTMPQKFGFSTDYRNYPFSSYKALANGSPSQLDQEMVWGWFGGKMQFSVFHQACYGWVKPGNIASSS